MIHKRIVSEMSKVDVPHTKIAEACVSISRRKAHNRYFEKLGPLVSEIIPLSAQISPSMLLGSGPFSEKEGRPGRVLELAGGLCEVNRNAQAINARIGKIEEEFEESVRRVDFEKLQKRENWYKFLHKAVVLPVRIAAYSVLGLVAACSLLNPLLGPASVIGEKAQYTLLMGGLSFSLLALTFSNFMDFFVNPAAGELKKNISDLREGISGMKNGVKELLETTYFFRGG